MDSHSWCIKTQWVYLLFILQFWKEDLRREDRNGLDLPEHPFLLSAEKQNGWEANTPNLQACHSFAFSGGNPCDFFSTFFSFSFNPEGKNPIPIFFLWVVVAVTSDFLGKWATSHSLTSTLSTSTGFQPSIWILT